MLPVIPGREILAVRLKPVDYRVGVLLDTSREYHQVEPPADAPQELVAVRPLVHIVQDGVLRADAGLATYTDVCRAELDLDHVSAVHAAALRHAVDQRLIQVED